MILPPNLSQPHGPSKQKAVELEAAFLSDMLAHAGLDRTTEGFGGGIGAEQFASFLRQEQAMAMAKAGGVGLAEQLFRAMQGDDAYAG